jgi:hypothetical protein
MAEGIARLQRLHWASGIRVNRAYLRWKYLDNPYVDSPLVYVALAGDQVVGMRGMFGSAWDLGSGTSARIPAASDSLIHPQHRDRGLFERLSALALSDLAGNGYSHVLNLSPTAANFVTSVLSMGWNSIGSTGELALMSHRSSARRELFLRIPRTQALRTAARSARRVRSGVSSRVFRHLDQPARDAVRVSRDPIPWEMAAVAAAEPPGTGIRQLRDSTFFSWRFQNPRADYRFLYIGEESITGFLVLQHSAGRSRVNIVDWSAGSDADAEALLVAAVTRGRFPDLRIWSRSLLPPRVELLERLGFSAPPPTSEPTRHAGKIMVRPTAATLHPANWELGGRDLSEAANWTLQMIAADAH